MIKVPLCKICGRPARLRRTIQKNGVSIVYFRCSPCMAYASGRLKHADVLEFLAMERAKDPDNPWIPATIDETSALFDNRA